MEVNVRLFLTPHFYYNTETIIERNVLPIIEQNKEMLNQ